ncbi:four-carbon acid sugar kinase family protein [Kaistia defluvii]|uniref:four-carbon acid sugar kinase family protein n=1 Tax=Kaistia defluvii TaxID=410841 RepID=UPI002250DD70|nr:four-carbon acid sugar kinase family protein [Kaistia defluvii]MCX5518795.1 four-carbon acid sugar kinase family protein [Kaistia defluvii]
MTRWLILADDLTGAADSAIPFARRGLASVVSWGMTAPGAPRTAIVSYNTDSRGLTAEAAAKRQHHALATFSEPGRDVFKKIDSTLRGQPAAEIAATMAHMKGRFGTAFGLLAPAFPATGRTTRHGRVLVNGQPLEQAEVWQRDHSYANADLADVLASAGMAAEVVPLSTIRASESELRAAFAFLAGQGDVVAICDAETEDDLRRIAAAGLPLAPGAFLIGSAGLASAVAALAPSTPASTPRFAAQAQGFLMVVGSLAAASRRGAAKLVASGQVVHVPISPETLLSDAAESAAIGQAVAARLDAGQDVLIEIQMGDRPEMALGPRLAESLADALAPAAARMGAFAATGGETAAALLSRFGALGIRLIDEIEPGVALGQALGALSCPVVTKAGAFGDDDSLGRIAQRLRDIRTQGNPA